MEQAAPKMKAANVKPQAGALLARAGVLFQLALILGTAPARAEIPAPRDYFVIRVLDDQTGRGVPLVELKTVSDTLYYTDSNGLVAYYEPGLMGREVFFRVKSHGYEYPADGYGNQGLKLVAAPGKTAVVKLKRLNIAERLYRVTGEGIYRDTVLAGLKAPIREPLLNGQVAGQDSVIAIPHLGKLYWFWGDTSRPSYPLGHFGTAGATSELPSRGGLDPSLGVDLTYFADENGFSRPMCDWDAPGMKWVSGLMEVKDPEGRDRLMGVCESHKSLGEIYEQSLVVFNDEKARFERLHILPKDLPLKPDGEPFRASVNGVDYFYFDGPCPTPCYRVKANWNSATNPAAYEGFTCLAEGARYEKARTRLDRGADGKVRYGWKRGTAPLDERQQAALVKLGVLQAREKSFHLSNFETGRTVSPRGNIGWNEYRKKWILVGWADLADIYYAEADTPVGPWVHARKIVTHDRYSFYNPRRHPFFDQLGGRLIYFEGTYSGAFSNPPFLTPRYNYNQIMYRLDLADPRLALPSPVYRATSASGKTRYFMAQSEGSSNPREIVEEIPFLAFEPDRPMEHLVPVRSMASANRDVWAAGPGESKPLFYALPAEASESEKKTDQRFAESETAPLHEYRRRGSGERRYSVDPVSPESEWERSPAPICRVWRNSCSSLLIDREASPVVRE
jgi:hypothetical protein